MTLPNILLWTLVISLTTIFGSWYARKYDKADAIIGLYVAFVVFSNIAAVKIASYDLGFTTYFATAASLIFPVTFLLTDIVNERFGRKETHRMIFIAFISQVFLAIFSYLVVSVPSAPFWTNQEALQSVIGMVPRIMVASWVAFLISENLDAYIFAWFKQKTGGKHLWARNVFSSIPSMLVDSVIFVVIAFGGVTPLMPLIIGVTVIKWLVGLVNIPFMYLNRSILGTSSSEVV
ncbi:hypothetical protein A3A71_04270 [Candidatus Berkelbacteria bacterium RIFCSPLOWO2_01_FULL_50_28]|uniref:Probable queuosine precursor transporter n=1 Tax=Candidatus Berkelbacteria bacterium RIFCSPLOWO2_01_FULL_50_28 TaxID=1797471 RepID=A0A1F5EAA4_9BACT|nr:MAG: hypothetical protein A2807_03340 [Candidatus Berkelbacteria bacterium RIFCSPHIGHO2_01_FULL_50_36]OGD62433.1 MAG: hypothetical protein A3F39_01875 [Candidatus Berkelbacteria bacterium RIFCSPHIGHO2_12_FULL_50_11]OGD64347.1 MAG: hypothetical protein A3A71_04270 [Candidatus Berkelbacteria bacterium RIFCSPLOWO2_01_FULL_50_28]